MTTPPRPWDSGLQIERTKLAWQRTALSTFVFSLVVTRLIATRSVVVAVIIGLLAAIAALTLGLTATLRHHRGTRALYAQSPLPDARSFAALCALTVVAGIGAAAYALTTWS